MCAKFRNQTGKGKAPVNAPKDWARLMSRRSRSICGGAEKNDPVDQFGGYAR